MEKKTILIVGGTGFLGFHLCSFFKKKGWKVYSLSKNKPLSFRKVKNINYLYGDISKQKEIEFLNNIKFEFLINCGGYVDHYNKIKTYNTHVVGCKNLYKISLKKKLKLFIQVGSASEYGSIGSPHKENKEGNPKDNYGKNKLEITKFLKNLNNNFPFVIVRPYQIYGPFQDENRLIPFIINSCLRNRRFPCSRGTQQRDFLFIDDFVSVIYKIITKKNSFKQIFNVGFGKPIEVKKVIKLICKKIKLGVPEYGKILFRQNEQKKLFPSIKKTSSELDWTPKVNLDKGLNITIKHYKDFLDLKKFN